MLLLNGFELLNNGICLTPDDDIGNRTSNLMWKKNNRVNCFFFPFHYSDKFCKPFNLVWRQIFTYVSIYRHREI